MPSFLSCSIMARKELSSTVRAAWRASKSERTVACLRRSLVIFKIQAVMKRTIDVISSSMMSIVVCVYWFVFFAGSVPLMFPRMQMLIHAASLFLNKSEKSCSTRLNSGIEAQSFSEKQSKNPPKSMLSIYISVLCVCVSLACCP